MKAILNTNGARGSTWSAGITPGNNVPIDRFHLARPERDSAGSINAALNSGQNVLFTPGIYHQDECSKRRSMGSSPALAAPKESRPMKTLGLVVQLHSLFPTGIGPVAGEFLGTRVALREGRWTINDRPAGPGSAAGGLLMNVRMVNAVFENRGKPDFDAGAGADRFIARNPDYAAHGVNAFTIWLQGGMPRCL